MKICVTSRGKTLESEVDPRFGRCAYFVIYDTDTLKSEFILNDNKDGMGGVGIQAGQMIAGKGIKAVLTGNIGPNAYRTLQAGGVDMFTGVTGQVLHAIDKFQRGEIKPSGKPSVDSHFGSTGDGRVQS